MKQLILQQFTYRREWLNRVINTAEAKWRDFSSGQSPLSDVATKAMHYHGYKENDSGGQAVHYSCGSSYSLNVSGHTIVLLVWAIIMNIYNA